MHSLFTFIYECLCGKNQNIPEYRERIFGSAGLLTFTLSLTVCILFYLAIGRWRNIWQTRSHWVITTIICAFIGFSIAYSVAKSYIGSADSYLMQFAITNAFVAMVYFVILSLLLKPFSIYAKRTPF